MAISVAGNIQLSLNLSEKIIWPTKLQKGAEVALILSGGMDSGVLLVFLAHRGIGVHCLSFDYLSRHNAKEIGMARELAKEYALSHKVVKLDFFQSLFSSALLQSNEPLPHGHYEDISMKKTVVPFRNGIMLSIACGFAENNNLPYVMIGSHQGDHSIYPDCRAEFTKVFSRAAFLGTYNGVKTASPFNLLDKKGIAQIGRELKFDFRKTWTCYEGGDIHCGLCGACNERKYALAYDRGLDPTSYRK